ncbi:MAG: response regulator [Anaerolineae bacterium]|nr:response regulator [Anaerolineae bacterium]
MSTSLITLVSICANIILGLVGLALALLILWQDRRHRSSQYFALCMAIFGVYGFLNAPWQAAQQFGMDPKPLFYAVTTCYIVGTTLLFKFIFAFARLSIRFRTFEAMLSTGLALMFMALLWRDQLTADFMPQDSGKYKYTLTSTGLAGVILVMVYLLGSIGLLHHQRNPTTRALSVPVIILTLGVVGFGAEQYLRDFPFNAVAVTVASMLLGRMVLQRRVFQPLADLTVELAIKNDQLIEATRLKSQFLANMSHELRTPLNSIIGYTELVAGRTYGDLNEIQEDRLRKVSRNGRLLLDLINDVLDLSKIEAGRVKLKCVQVSTVDLLNGLLTELEGRALGKGLSVVRGYSDLPPMFVDQERARQILWNLITNAIKFTEQGAVIIRGYYDDAQEQVVLIITDTGTGIPPHQQEKIFDAYVRGDNVLVRQHEGTGLGLPIAKLLTDLHGGHLWFESDVGKGTTFHVALPAAEKPDYTMTQLKPKPRTSGPVILVIDDDFEAVEVLQDQLAIHRLRVYGVCNPNDGLRLAHDLRPALIMLDIMMPGMNGWQALDALRSDPATRDIPVLMVSATDSADMAQTVGANGFLRKPVQPRELLAHVNRLLASV